MAERQTAMTPRREDVRRFRPRTPMDEAAQPRLGLPRRKGESIESTVGNERGKESDRNAPLSEEETCECEPRNQRPRSWRDVND
jgi:hypothetical protein